MNQNYLDDIDEYLWIIIQLSLFETANEKELVIDKNTFTTD